MLTEESHGEPETVTSPKRPRKNEILDSSILGTMVDMMADDSGDREDDTHLQEDAFKITSYLQEPNLLLYSTIPSVIDPEKVTMKRNNSLQYWKDNYKSKPLLAKLAKKYFSGPADRLFSMLL